MTRFAPWAAIVTSLVAVAGPVHSQEITDDLYARPQTPAEYWRAAKFELAVGKFDLAGQLLQGFLAANPKDDDYLAIERQDGINALLRLRNIPKWTVDAKADAAIRQDVEKIIENTMAAQKRQLADPVRITRLLTNLSGDAEERDFALRELVRSGAAVVPVIYDLLRNKSSDVEQATLLSVLPELPDTTVPPLIAALDTTDAALRTSLFSALTRRKNLVELTRFAESDPLPVMIYLAASRDEPGLLQQRAAQELASLQSALGVKAHSPVDELTRLAERFLNHKARFIDPRTVTLWALDRNDTLISTPATIAQAEEYFGIRYARRALELNPTYDPAQIVLLSLAVERAVERSAPLQPMALASPSVYRLLTGSRVGLLAETLDRALIEKRAGVAMAVAMALRDRGETMAHLSDRPEPPVLVRALRFPDRRVQLAAAEALVRLPGPPSHQVSAAIVEVLRRALAAEPDPSDPAAGKPRVLIADPDRDRAEAIARVAREAGFDSSVAQTGRQLLQRLNEAADVDIIVVDHQIPYPQLPYVLAELRADVHYGLTPVKVMTASAPLDRRSSEPEAVVRRLIAPYKNVEVIGEPFTPSLLTRDLADVGEAPAGRPLSAEEKKNAARRALELLQLMATGSRVGYDVRPAIAALRQTLRGQSELTAPAIDTLGRLSGREIQADLAGIVLAETRPPQIRAQAAEQLTENLQRFGVGLSPSEIEAIQRAAGQADLAPGLRAALEALAGKFQTDRAKTGALLQTFPPPLPTPAGAAPVAPAPAAPPPEEAAPPAPKAAPADEDEGSLAP